MTPELQLVEMLRFFNSSKHGNDCRTVLTTVLPQAEASPPDSPLPAPPKFFLEASHLNTDEAQICLASETGQDHSWRYSLDVDCLWYVPAYLFKPHPITATAMIYTGLIFSFVSVSRAYKASPHLLCKKVSRESENVT